MPYRSDADMQVEWFRSGYKCVQNPEYKSLLSIPECIKLRFGALVFLVASLKALVFGKQK